ncbi:MAG TPA: AMP-binding protein [Prolixibacteraceae bacterium]|nr:AMP-binding protein [Prolixibacteraceae bacterium]
MSKAIIRRDNLDKKYIITHNQDITGHDLLKYIQQYSLLIGNQNITKIGIYSENRLEWIYAFYASLQYNCIAIPIDYMASAEDVAYIIDDCQPEILFISAAMQEAYAKVKLKSTFQPKIIVFEDHPPVADQPESTWEGPDDNDNTAVIIYTSGTTGSPKGVMLSYTNIIQNMNAVIDAKIFHAESQTLVLLPLHHIFPLVGSMMVPLYAGGVLVVSPSMQTADLMKTLADNQVTVMIGVPRLYDLMYRGLLAKINSSVIAKAFLNLVYRTKSRKLGKTLFKKIHNGLGGHLLYMIAGGAALNKEVGTFFYLIGFDILEGFGMTEAAPMITFPRPGNVKIGSTGQALPGLTVEIRDGEIVAKGPSIMKGYYNRPEETAEVIKDGWLYTGDLGRIEKGGFLYITGRKKEIIVLPNGKNINPVEVEMKLEGSSPAIKEAGVFMHKEMLHAVILPDHKFLEDNHIDDVSQYFRESVLSPFNAEMSSYKRIMQFTLVNTELPRTRLSKLQRFKLEDLINKTESEKPVSKDPDTAEYRAVKSFIESQVDMDVSPEDHLIFDIALDSLGKLSLIDFIDKTFGVKIDEEQLLKFPSIKTISEYVRTHKLFHKQEDATWTGDLKADTEVDLPKYSILLGAIVHSVRSVANVFIKTEVKGLENIPDGACFFAPNHQSKLDAFLVLSYLDKKTLRETYSYAKKDHVKGAIRKYLAHRTNIIIMDLARDLKESIHKMAAVVKLGKKILIFPEGTRTETGGIGSFKKTYAILSTELNVPVVPVAISGAFYGDKKDKMRVKRTKINVEFLPAIDPDGMNPDELNELVKQRIEEKSNQ